MGCGSVSKEANPLEITTQEKSQEVRSEQQKVNPVSIDVIEVSNIALAIKNGDQNVTNVEVTVGCRNLPTSKGFSQEIHTMVVLFKSCPELLEIGRTQVVSKDPNPKFLTTFLLPSVSGNQQQIILHIYNIIEFGSTQLSRQKLIGKTQLKIQNLIDIDSSELPVTLTNSSSKEHTYVHINCCEYDGGGMEYEVLIEAAQFTGKLELYYVIEVQKDNDWIPVAKSNKIKKSQSFELVKVSSHKFPGEQSARIRLRCYDASKNDEQQLGFTDDIVLGALVSGQQKGNPKRIEKNGFVVGNLIVKQWKKVNRDSFLTYIVNGARLHLILGIDYTNSTFKEPMCLHHPDDDKNLYVTAIKEIVGMLQYFDYYNQIALYGFGAKLPPYYQSVGQCFALNGNYFQPLIVGGVDKIIKLYRENLQKIKPHGPSKLSEVINMAIQFAQSSEGQSTNYYVLIILTDGTVDDFNDTVDKIVEAQNLPLSIVIVCLGEGDFTQIKKLDQDQQLLQSEKKGKAIRDMIDVIDFKEYITTQRNALTEVHLARKTFAQIPSQFVGYMQGKGIRPNKQKKGIKTAKLQFLSQKINTGKKKENQPIIPEVQFLKEQKRKLTRELIALGIQPGKEFDQTLEISMNDLNYFLEIYSTKLPPSVKEYRPFQESISFRQQKRFEEKIERNEKLAHQRIQNQILKKETNLTGKRQRIIERVAEAPQKKPPKLRNPCLKCRQKEICIVYGDCGHLAVCTQCQESICIVCKQFNQTFLDISNHEN